MRAVGLMEEFTPGAAVVVVAVVARGLTVRGIMAAVMRSAVGHCHGLGPHRVVLMTRGLDECHAGQ